MYSFFFFQAEDGIRDLTVTGVQTCALPIFAWNRNKVLSLGPDTILLGADQYVGGGAHQNPTVLKVGEPINSFYGWVYEGLENGQPVYQDLDGDGKRGKDDADDRRIIGNAEPKYTGGFDNRFTFHNFELGGVLQGGVGKQNYHKKPSLSPPAR